MIEVFWINFVKEFCIDILYVFVLSIGIGILNCECVVLLFFKSFVVIFDDVIVKVILLIDCIFVKIVL